MPNDFDFSDPQPTGKQPARPSDVLASKVLAFGRTLRIGIIVWALGTFIAVPLIAMIFVSIIVSVQSVEKAKQEKIDRPEKTRLIKRYKELDKFRRESDQARPFHQQEDFAAEEEMREIENRFWDKWHETIPAHAH